MKTEIRIRTFNAKKMAIVLKDINERTKGRPYMEGYNIYRDSINTLIKVLEELK